MVPLVFEIRIPELGPLVAAYKMTISLWSSKKASKKESMTGYVLEFQCRGESEDRTYQHTSLSVKQFQKMTFQSAFKLIQFWKTCDLWWQGVPEHWAIYSEAELSNSCVQTTLMVLCS